MNAVGRERPITIAILAIGGQGGGVITDWLIELGERNGWYVQATSVPGVAQRTGATLYYVEMIPESGRTPILAMMPTPGDVDIVIAAEMMEAGRAMQRGLVTPDRTTLIASSHRAYGILEKTAPGEALADTEKVAAIARKRAKRFIAFDMQRIADENGSVISASLFGALAGAQVLPFAREEFEATIRHGGKGIEPSLEAFGAGCDSVTLAETGLIGLTPTKSARTPPVEPAGGSEEELRQYGLAVERTKSFPYEAAAMALAGFRHAVDFQDVAYGYEYLDRLSEISGIRPGTRRPRPELRPDPRDGEVSRPRHGLRRRHPGRRFEDTGETPGPRARRGRRGGCRGRPRHRVHASAHGGDLRDHAGALGPLDRGAAAALRDARPRPQPRPPCAHRLAPLVHGALSARRPEAAPADAPPPRDRDGASRRLARQDPRDCAGRTTISPSRS